MKRFLVVAGVAAATLLAAGAARAGGVNWSIGINLPPVATYVSNGPGYYPAPAVYAPRRVYVAPRPVYVEPAYAQPVYDEPQYVVPRYAPQYAAEYAPQYEPQYAARVVYREPRPVYVAPERVHFRAPHLWLPPLPRLPPLPHLPGHHDRWHHDEQGDHRR